MRSRLEFDEELRELIGNGNVYYQPPESIKMKFPCIRYKMVDVNIKRADDLAYHKTPCYEVTVISKDPDFFVFEEIIDRFPMCRVGRPFYYDNLNHRTYTIYY